MEIFLTGSGVVVDSEEVGHVVAVRVKQQGVRLHHHSSLKLKAGAVDRVEAENGMEALFLLTGHLSPEHFGILYKYLNILSLRVKTRTTDTRGLYYKSFYSSNCCRIVIS